MVLRGTGCLGIRDQVMQRRKESRKTLEHYLEETRPNLVLHFKDTALLPSLWLLSPDRAEGGTQRLAGPRKKGSRGGEGERQECPEGPGTEKG